MKKLTDVPTERTLKLAKRLPSDGATGSHSLGIEVGLDLTNIQLRHTVVLRNFSQSSSLTIELSLDGIVAWRDLFNEALAEAAPAHMEALL